MILLVSCFIAIGMDLNMALWLLSILILCFLNALYDKSRVYRNKDTESGFYHAKLHRAEANISCHHDSYPD